MEDASPPPPTILADNGSDGDDLLYADQDDAQSLIQPALSPVATRLTSARTPAAEKAAAMDGLFDPETAAPPPMPSLSHSSDSSSGPDEYDDDDDTPAAAAYRRTATPAPPPRPPGLPSPWQAEPRVFTVTESPPTSPKMTTSSSMFGVFNGSRPGRSASGGEKALKRLSKVLPSLSIPTRASGFMASMASPSFLSGFQKGGGGGGGGQLGHGGDESESPAADLKPYAPVALRKSSSNDSLLYHSLSRVSSFGDDSRFVNVREQVNSRFKAIKDSWDGPQFRMPQFPNILGPPPRKSLTESALDGGRHRLGPSHADKRMSREISALDFVLESLTGDIVVMGGYRGSILRSSHPPHRQLWVPVKVGLNIRKVNLEVGLDPEDEDEMEKHIFASGMLQNIGPVDISKRLFKKLRECENARTGKLRVHDYGYDWRLSPHLLSRKLTEFLEKLPSNQPSVPAAQRGALVIAHSLGGIITRHAVNQRPELFSGVVYAGTPQRCINVLGPLRNGDAVLLNEKVLTAQVNFSLRTTFVFLPEDGFCFIDKTTGEPYPVDFYDADHWVRHRLSPCVSGPALPPAAPSRPTSTLGSLLNLSDSLPLRVRSNSLRQRRTPADAVTDSAAAVPPLSPQSPPTTTATTPSSAAHDRNMAYLRRTLAETKRFRAELAHRPAHQAANAYPPLAIMYGKDTPTVWGARVAGPGGAARADAYDDLVFRGGDGVVLAREAMLPEGYALARNGRVCTDRGHVSILGDLNGVGRALEAVVRGRGKGIGRGIGGGEGE
ncbi:hypothetical protein B0T18DRAFT_333245 [Schizothecium vesticola]|uniref:Uncharacterized protein n=1 Tax=Schizothecium vesticola TaxID=314040 RepID=A0AA40EGZ5_9PEZI|nr:hypothetical protein B0T18DRAFT_333245 [Schizothecium vesticola]